MFPPTSVQFSQLFGKEKVWDPSQWNTKSDVTPRLIDSLWRIRKQVFFINSTGYVGDGTYLWYGDIHIHTIFQERSGFMLMFLRTNYHIVPPTFVCTVPSGGHTLGSFWWRLLVFFTLYFFPFCALCHCWPLQQFYFFQTQLSQLFEFYFGHRVPSSALILWLELSLVVWGWSNNLTISAIPSVYCMTHFVFYTHCFIGEKTNPFPVLCLSIVCQGRSACKQKCLKVRVFFLQNHSFYYYNYKHFD